jgi:hypothetical protein
MLRTPRNAAVGAVLVVALATVSHRAAAQDSSSAGQAPPDTSAYTGGVSRDTTDTTLRTGVERVDTTTLPGPGGMSDTSAGTDTSGFQPTLPGSADSTDTTRIGETKSHHSTHATRRMHPADSAQARDGETAGASDTAGMAGRRSTSSDSSPPADSTSR